MKNKFDFDLNDWEKTAVKRIHSRFLYHWENTEENNEKYCTDFVG